MDELGNSSKFANEALLLPYGAGGKRCALCSSRLQETVAYGADAPGLAGAEPESLEDTRLQVERARAAAHGTAVVDGSNYCLTTIFDFDSTPKV